jgi:chromosome segregation ATPase
MAKGKCKNKINRTPVQYGTLKLSSFTIASSGYTNTPEEQGYSIQSHLMNMIEVFNEEINKSLKEIQENIFKPIEPFKEETNKFLKELLEHTMKHVKKTNKTVQDLKMEIEATKKIELEATLETENLGKRTETIDTSIINRIQEMEQKISGIEDTIKEIDTSIKENAKSEKFLTQNIQEICKAMKISNLGIIG